MKVVSLVDNTTLPQRKDLNHEAGLSLWIRLDEQQVLFDTGISGVFQSNAQRLNVDISQVALAIISHHHFDHGGGLSTFFGVNKSAKVYLKSSPTEQFYFDVYGLLKRWIGLDETLFRQHSQRFVFINQLSEIAPGVFILTEIGKRHPLPKGNHHLYIISGKKKRLDDFEHELLLVVKERDGIAVFSGCSHHGILNILDAVVERFPDQPIKALFGGFHLIDLPIINNLAGSKEEVENLGRAILGYPLEKVYTGHCTGKKAYRILKQVMGSKLESFTTGSQVEI